MSARVEQQVDRLIFSGELTRATIPELWAQRRQWLSGQQQLTLDLAAVQRIDSAGIAMLLRLKGLLQQQQGDLYISKANTQLLQMATVSGVAELLALA